MLADRVLAARCRRVALLGIHPRAGSRTALGAIVRALHAREHPFAVMSCHRPLVEEVMTPEPVTRIALPAGAWIVNPPDTPRDDDIELELVEETAQSTSAGHLGIYRVVRGGEIELCVPTEPEELGAITNRAADLCGGTVLIDGGWTRRGFAQPGVADAVVLSVGCGFSGTPERSAAAVRFLVETLRAPAAPGWTHRAWEFARERNKILVCSLDGRELAALRPGSADALVQAAAAERAVSLVLPRTLGDELMAPFARAGFACRAIVKDATRVNVSPVYLKAWQKAGGSLHVVQPINLIGVTTNPMNFAGDDADPGQFRDLVDGALGELPVHDVVLDSPEASRRAVWKFWE